MTSSPMDRPAVRSAAGKARAGFAPVPRPDRVVWTLAVLTAIAALGLTVNPWSRDGWFQTQYLLVGHFPGHDDYTPIAAPALVYACAHGIARLLSVGIAGEFYIACILQNLMLLASACFVYRALRLLGFARLAGPVSIVFLLFALSTGVAQQFYSEDTVLFLMSGVLLALVAILRGGAEPPRRFWTLAIVCGLLVGLLAATRMTPLFLIPAAAFLLFGRIPPRRLVQLIGALSVLTAALLAGMMLANHARFGRYEITNSTGRHLWQGVKDFSDRALARSARYQALKRLDPHVQGTYWDKLPPITHDSTRADPREPMLLGLAKQAIRNAPGLYLLHGATKFVHTVGRAPSRDAFFRMPGDWNPLHRTTNLPSLLDALGAPRVLGRMVMAVYAAVYAAFDWLYPVSIFAIAVTCLAALLQRLHARPASADSSRPGRTSAFAGGEAVLLGGGETGLPGVRPALAVFYAAGIVLACIPLVSVDSRVGKIAGCAACALLLGACGAMLTRALQKPPGPQGAATPRAPRMPVRTGAPLQLDAPVTEPAGVRIRFLAFAALLLFGTLWFTWQVEVASPRYALPFLPFWSVMLAIAGCYWRALDALTAPQRSRPPAQDDAASPINAA